MKYVIDLTKNNFDKIDFTEAKIIDFYCQHKLPSSLEFKVWGATLLLEPRWKHAESFDSSLPRAEDMYVAGMGVVKIDRLIGGNIEVYAYDNVKEDNLIKVAKNYDGSELVFRREWPINKTVDTDEYLWESVISWPYGFCNLRLLSDHGKVSFEFDSNDMVPVGNFILNPERYGFNANKLR
ncbi:hypothetical protein J4772_00670 [Cohnella sp. LGH]|uniref:hypothetical protein n=1 Tax=Cohnella sp. LGH TaxID=1619153 RepID=UPI001ADB45B0|nr:hypothetical protein [Cohnella sp. LGH]QTH43041.1 hypothetical protein J4772_00670 [Cohnella sp. LGH]